MNASNREKVTILEKPRIIRGPYLQRGTDSSIIIRWATLAPVQGRVWYGTDPDRLSLTLADLEAAGVDIVLGGHSHSYERSYLIDGHYGLSDSFTSEMKKDGGSGRESESASYQKRHQTAHEGTVYIVAGTSGLADEVSKHPAMHTSLSIPGSLVLDVRGKRLDVTFIDECGEIKDYFTLKGSPEDKTIN